MKACCNAAARSGGTPGGATNGHAMVSNGVSVNSINSRAAALGANSRAVGTSGNCGLRCLRAYISKMR